LSERKPASTRSRFRSLADPETLSRIVQNLGEGIYITNTKGEILDANAAFLRIFGVPSLDALKEYRVSDFVDAEIRRREVALLEREGSIRDRELQITRPDGAVRTVLDTWYSNIDPETGEAVFHGILVDITSRKQLENQLIEQSIRDPLTGCYNRRHLATLYSEPRDASKEWGCIYVDIDHFKQYNDRHGHQLGDKLLADIAVLFKRTTRSIDYVARYGGDEFLLLLHEVASADALMLADRIRSVVAAATFGPGDHKVTVSIGVASYPEHGETAEAVIASADAGLYKAKRSGRNETVLAGNDRRGQR
jgi:diguanylate cyclase (GGDEF)-like protein/PAS domain S-box-containing protein